MCTEVSEQVVGPTGLGGPGHPRFAPVFGPICASKPVTGARPTPAFPSELVMTPLNKGAAHQLDRLGAQLPAQSGSDGALC